MSCERKLTARLDELEKANEAATGWGAAVGARHEEIKSIKGRLSTPQGCDPCSWPTCGCQLSLPKENA